MEPFRLCKILWKYFGISLDRNASEKTIFFSILSNIFATISLLLAFWFAFVYFYTELNSDDVMPIVFSFLEMNVADANLMSYISMILVKRNVARLTTSFDGIIRNRFNETTKEIYKIVEWRTNLIIFILFINFCLYSMLIIASFFLQLAWDYWIRGEIDLTKWFNLLILK